jgi:hypothetical protein
MSAADIGSLMERHGDRLLERNVRRYLGLQGNRVNQDIQYTLLNDPGNFYFFNNGVTLTCDKFDYSSLQQTDHRVQVKDLQIINGGQTCMTIWKTLQNIGVDTAASGPYVLVRLYQLPSNNDDLVRKITYATNSQNPVDLKDLRANDDIQRKLEMNIRDLGYTYRRKRTDVQAKPTDITVGLAAESVLSVWRKKPHQAKFFAREHFGRLYDDIFTQDINGSQVIIAGLIYRIAENRRRRPAENDSPIVRYASCFLAMQMGKHLLRDMNCAVQDLNHNNFRTALELTEKNGNTYFKRAVNEVLVALYLLYSSIKPVLLEELEKPLLQKLSLQQLSATFRRGDLIATIEYIESTHGTIENFLNSLKIRDASQDLTSEPKDKS